MNEPIRVTPELERMSNTDSAVRFIIALPSYSNALTSAIARAEEAWEADFGGAHRCLVDIAIDPRNQRRVLMITAGTIR